MLSREIPVIVFCVGSHGSDIEAENSYKTLLGYEQMASKIRKAPIPMVYFQNNDTKTPEEIDTTFSIYLPLIAGILSGKNHGLDSMDIRNFLYYNRVSDFKPALTQLDLYQGEVTLNQGESVLSMLTITRVGTSVPTDVMVRYQATGVMHPTFAEANENYDCLRVAMVSNHFQAVIANLQAIRDRFAEAAAKNEHRGLIVDESIESEDDGLIL